jgi:hypothetical protein
MPPYPISLECVLATCHCSSIQLLACVLASLVHVCLAFAPRVCVARHCLVHEVLEVCLGFLFPGVRHFNYFDYSRRVFGRHCLLRPKIVPPIRTVRPQPKPYIFVYLSYIYALNHSYGIAYHIWG